MKSFSSSAINKSGKKFAPKVPARRAAPAAAPARRPSAAQQAQVKAAQAQVTQATQATQPEREEVEATPVTAPSASPAVPEPSAIEETLIPAAPVAPAPVEPAAPVQAQETTDIAPTPTPDTTTIPTPTAIPIPFPKRKAPAPTPTPEPVPTPPATITPTPRIEGSASPRTLPAELSVLPSIEHDVEQTVANELTLEAAQSASNLSFITEVPAVSVSTSEAPETPPVTIKLKGARKTSEITKLTKPRAKPRPKGPLATPPATQPRAPTVGRTKASQASSGTRKRKASKAAASDADGTQKPKKTRRRQREITPEDAETVEILPNVIKMSELCKDLKTGRKSKREERKQKAQEAGTPADTPKKSDDKKKNSDEDRLDEGVAQAGPVMRIVNGEIVLDATSLEVDRHADAQRDVDDMITVEENQLTRRVNQATYGKRSKTETWDEENTDLFYRGLRMFGTDFQMISKLFPGRSRRQIKLKFNNEERKDPQRITATLLGPREIIDITTYEEMTNQTYDDPNEIQRELDAEREEIEKQHEKEKQLQEDMLRNPTGAGTDGNAADDKANIAPTKKKRMTKKQMASAAGGTEEVIGTIDD
ncbi:hypothetical protein N7493_007236 [Penicillium malachiteum]|uniref:Myb-like domain-containing protein n=1 Tax=Penicillium malachiteum TaxID=1324776 RepID=A0AAD6HJ03_9EURO|nr:hypothetical protein N7493_007236 [Penicillium malachiteum]